MLSEAITSGPPLLDVQL